MGESDKTCEVAKLEDEELAGAAGGFPSALESGFGHTLEKCKNGCSYYRESHESEARKNGVELPADICWHCYRVTLDEAGTRVI